LNLSRRTRWLIGLGYAAAVVIVYNSNWAKLNEIIRIPFIEYLVAFILAGFVALGIWTYDRLKNLTLPNNSSLEPGMGAD
jgi:hypothetical protein